MVHVGACLAPGAFNCHERSVTGLFLFSGSAVKPN